jgi:3-phosphoshikimate 1-carboxyvinyltransferase
MQPPSQLEIVPLVRPPRASIRVPGSKSITNRALVLAALTASREHDTVLEGALKSDDTEVMIESLRRLGFLIATTWGEAEVRVRKQKTKQGGVAGLLAPLIPSDIAEMIAPVIPVDTADLFVDNSGTSMRFLTAMVALGRGRYRLDGIQRMRERPIEDLLSALRQLGVNAVSENGDGCPPVLVESSGLRGGCIRIKGNTSSQFLSGLLMAASRAQGAITIDVDGPLVSVPYARMTLEMMRQFGVVCKEDPPGRFVVLAITPTPLTRYVIEPDASAASYFFGAAAIAGGSVSVTGLASPWAATPVKSVPITCLQGDVRFVELLEQMGCWVEHAVDAITVHGGPLHGIDVDMNDISDTVMTLAAVACFAEGPTTIRNVAHIRHKETDRLAAIATELRRLGAHVVERADGLTITPAPMHGAVVQTYNDHRMAMSLALIGLKVPGVVIDNPACVAKTYPLFFDDLERLR